MSTIAHIKNIKQYDLILSDFQIFLFQEIKKHYIFLTIIYKILREAHRNITYYFSYNSMFKYSIMIGRKVCIKTVYCISTYY